MRKRFIRRRSSTAWVERSVIALIEDSTPNSASKAPNSHEASPKVPRCQQQRTAAKNLQDRTSLATLGRGQPRSAGNILGFLRNLQRILRGTDARPLADPPDILGEPNQPSGLFGTEGRPVSR